ncbi:hypothetical protein SAMN04489724_4031 [Algoriphagus locisalis]|uniref:Uncharacterized protein n=1 Tax=Algoriphagus locisalis TaxID=305507 RepID=A0A1I7DG29_9BACT|nr:hypothetical protein SAMN04489724_4031 [Algoriphagus locisalis]
MGASFGAHFLFLKVSHKSIIPQRRRGAIILLKNMDIRNDASNQYFSAQPAGRPMTEDSRIGGTG